ncbi:hypothetical protein DAMA08_008410 [Martiniozyma asiatica (nom. inval.)]|nr:hypothetical protein DAMA08_008410 [Martiniozyma asiatica]
MKQNLLELDLKTTKMLPLNSENIPPTSSETGSYIQQPHLPTPALSKPNSASTSNGSHSNASFSNSTTPSSGSIPSTGSAPNCKKNKNRRKYNFQRASIACDECRKAKTRCSYLNDGISCFRCENLGLSCSLKKLKRGNSIMTTFQRTTNMDESDNVIKNKKRKKNDVSGLTMPINNSISSTMGAGSMVNSAKTDFFAVSNSSSTSGGSSSPLGYSKSQYLNLINNKIDKLNENVKLLLSKSNGASAGASSSVSSFENARTNEFLANTGFQGYNMLNDGSTSLSGGVSSSQSNRLTNLLPTKSSSESTNMASYLPPLQELHRVLAQPISISNKTGDLSRNTDSDPSLQISSLIGNFNNDNSSRYSNKLEIDEFYFANAPMMEISIIGNQLGFPFSKDIGFDIQQDQMLQSIILKYDLIERKILDYDTCLKLVDTALMHYGNWISHVECDIKKWLDATRFRSPLLVSICTLLGLRHIRVVNTLNQNIEVEILQTINQLLSLSIYEVEQSKEFLQSIVLLSHFAPSLSFKNIYFDGWGLSCYGMIHFTTEMTAKFLFSEDKNPNRIHYYRLWNHLTLCHLVNSIFSGRPCMIDQSRLAHCKNALDLPEATSFDGKIVAEICITHAMYTSLQHKEDISLSLRAINNVFSDWKYLAEQTTFGNSVLIHFLYAKNMVLRRYLVTNIKLSGSSIYGDYAKEFLMNSVEILKFYSNFSKEELISSNDNTRLIGFFSAFTILNFKKQGIISDIANDYLILECVDRFIEVSTWMESNIHYFNRFITHYLTLMLRMKDLVLN